MAGRRPRGEKELLALLKQYADEAPAITSEVLNGWGEDVRDDAKARAPRDTGRMVNAIRSIVTGPLCKVGIEGTAGDRQSAYYAVFVENGTSSMAARPFLWPAARAHQDVRPYVRRALDKRV